MSGTPLDQPAVTATEKVLHTVGGSATAILVLGYSCGFVIANTHLSRFMVVDFDIIRGRYLAAAILFAVCIASPLAAGVFAAIELLHGGQRRSFRALLAAASVVTGFVAEKVLLQVVVVEPMPPLGSEEPALSASQLSYPWLFVAFTTSIGFLIGALRSFPSRAPTTADRSRRHVYLIGAAPVFLALATGFALTVYPFVTPSFGGGAAWLARITLLPGTVADYYPSTVLPQSYPSGEVTAAVVFADKQELVLFLCLGDRDAHRLYPLTIARERAVTIRLVEPFTALPQNYWSSTACFGPPPTGQNPNPTRPN